MELSFKSALWFFPSDIFLKMKRQENKKTIHSLQATTTSWIMHKGHLPAICEGQLKIKRPWQLKTLTGETRYCQVRSSLPAASLARHFCMMDYMWFSLDCSFSSLDCTTLLSHKTIRSTEQQGTVGLKIYVLMF